MKYSEHNNMGYESEQGALSSFFAKNGFDGVNKRVAVFVFSKTTA